MMTAPVATGNELDIVKEVVILPFVLSVFERDRISVSTTLKTPSPYIAAIDVAMNRIAADINNYKKQLRKSGIKVYDPKRNNDGIISLYVCRGYEGHFSTLWSNLKVEVEIRMSNYLSKLENELITALENH